MITPHPYYGYEPKSTEGCMPTIIAIIVLIIIIIGFIIFKQ